jgi:hypothetical protein
MAKALQYNIQELISLTPVEYLLICAGAEKVFIQQ